MHKTFPINFEWDIVNVRSEVREIAKELGFDELDQSRIVQSISELARNVVQHAEKGLITISSVDEKGCRGLKIQVQDKGPGLVNLEEVARGKTRQVGQTSGLHHVYMLMDEFRQIPVESGTCVEAIKWLKNKPIIS